MTAVADTRLLLTLEFPPNEETKKRAEVLVQREIARRLLASSIVLAEFVRIAVEASLDVPSDLGVRRRNHGISMRSLSTYLTEIRDWADTGSVSSLGVLGRRS